MTGLSNDELLSLLPQARPFLFLDEIVEVNAESIVARYTFRPDEFFYTGHFPGNAVTPGVILLEAMAQAAVVAHGIYLVSMTRSPAEIRALVTLFAEAEVEFTGIVRPGDRVTIRSKKVYFRRHKLKAQAEMMLDDGTIVCSGTVAGIGVPENGV